MIFQQFFFQFFFIDGELQDLKENFFYTNWKTVEIKNEAINFILPLEDLEDTSKIQQFRNKIEAINIDDLVGKYDTKNYAFALLDLGGNKLNIHIKTNFNNQKMSKNFSYELNNIKDTPKLSLILKDIKIEITDIWKEMNKVNLMLPLTIKIKFQHKNLIELDKLKNSFYNISIIDSHSLDEFDINNSFFKIYYYGNPKRLKTELLKFGYQLKNDKGYWELYTYE